MADAKALAKVEPLPPWWEDEPLPEPPCQRRLSPHRARRTAPATIVVVHCTAGSSTQGAIDAMVAAGVSAQIVIPDDSKMYEPKRTVRVVEDAHYGYHVRRLTFKGESGINHRSFGIELVHTGAQGDEYTDWQVAEAARWTRFWMSRHPIAWVVTHAALDPARRRDPTDKFPWDEFMARVLLGSRDVEEEANLPVKLSWLGAPVEADVQVEEGSSYVRVADLARHLGLRTEWDARSKTVKVVQKTGSPFNG